MYLWVLTWTSKYLSNSDTIQSWESVSSYVWKRVNGTFLTVCYEINK